MNINDNINQIFNHNYEKEDIKNFKDSILSPLKKQINSVINDDQLSLSEKKDKIDELFREANKDLDKFTIHSDNKFVKNLELKQFKSTLHEYKIQTHESFINGLVDHKGLKDFDKHVKPRFNDDVNDMIVHTDPKHRDKKLNQLYHKELKGLQDSNYDDISYQILKSKLDEELENAKEKVNKMKHIGTKGFFH